MHPLHLRYIGVGVDVSILSFFTKPVDVSSHYPQTVAESCAGTHLELCVNTSLPVSARPARLDDAACSSTRERIQGLLRRPGSARQNTSESSTRDYLYHPCAYATDWPTDSPCRATRSWAPKQSLRISTACRGACSHWELHLSRRQQQQQDWTHTRRSTLLPACKRWRWAIARCFRTRERNNDCQIRGLSGSRRSLQWQHVRDAWGEGSSWSWHTKSWDYEYKYCALSLLFQLLTESCQQSEGML